uniref:Uncharacterized protein n=1 Tax=Panagrolaimus sp. JU765 TaxID=591449 RepID=A0AC34QRN5_9BILA
MQLDSEDEMMRNMSNRYTFAHCEYNFTGEFDLRYCGTRILNENYAFRILKPGNKDANCVDLYQKIKCGTIKSIHDFDHILKNESYPYKKTVKCEGVMKNSISNIKTQSRPFSIVPNETFLELLNETNPQHVQAQDLIGFCPKCEVLTRQFRFPNDNKCYVQIRTLEKGWPAFLEDCDDVGQILHASTQCEQAEEKVSNSTIIAPKSKS